MMKKVYVLLVVVFSFLIGNALFAQDMGPERIKSFDSKDLARKTLIIPVYDMVKALISNDAFKGFDTDLQIEEEYKKRWEEAIKESMYDFTNFDFQKYNLDNLKSTKDKTALVMYFEKDFYENWYGYLAITEPSYTIVAHAVVNGLDLGKKEDITFVMNMFAFSITASSQLYESTRGLSRNHQFVYREVLQAFSTNLKNASFFVPEFDKKVKNYKKKNQKMLDFMNEKWYISRYELLLQEEINKRVALKKEDEYFITFFKINTGNTFIQYDYYVISTARDKAVLYMGIGGQEPKLAHLSVFQKKIDEWLLLFLDANAQKERLKEREDMKSKKKGKSKKAEPSKSSKSTKSSKSSTPASKDKAPAKDSKQKK